MLYIRHCKTRDAKLLHLGVISLSPTGASVFGRRLPWYGASKKTPSGYRVAEFQHKPAYTEKCKACLLCGLFKPRSSLGTTVTPQGCDLSLLWMPGGHVALASVV